MIWLLKFLFYGHVHKWECINERKLTRSTWDGEVADTGTRYILKCTKCGEIQMRDLI